MQHERYVGYEIKALSNLLRRRLWGPADHPQSMLTEIEGVLIGYLCHSQGREIYQKDLERALWHPQLHRLPAAEAAGGRGPRPALYGGQGRPDEADHAHTPGAGAESGGRAADRRHRGDADQRHLSGGD